MFSKIILLTNMFLLAGMIHLHSQGPPKTPEQFLTQAGVSLDTNSLIQALYDSKTGVAACSSTVLAEKGITEAIPVIASQMKLTQDKTLVLTFAQSLNTLGSVKGTKQLEAFCLEEDIDSGERMRAAYALVYTKDYRCLPAVARYLSSNQADEKQSALLYLAQIPSFQDNEPKTLGPALLTIATGDSNKPFRILASKVIEQIGDLTTKDALLKHRMEDPN